MTKSVFDKQQNHLLNYWKCKCPDCTKPVVINLSSQRILKYGFICPYCDTVVAETRMWLAIIDSETILGTA